MAFQVSNLTDRVKSFIRGGLQQAPKTLSNIGSYLPQGNASTTGILGSANQNTQRIANTGIANNFNRNLNTVKKYGASNFYQGNFPHAYKAAEGFGEGLSFNLVDIPGYKSVTPQEKASYFTGAVGGLVSNPLSKGLNPFGAADKLGGKIVSKLAPNLTGVTSKIAGGVAGEAIQTAGYLGAGELGRRAGINKFRPLTKESILPETAKQFAFGLGARGVLGGAGNFMNQFRGMSDKDRKLAEVYAYAKENAKVLREFKRGKGSPLDKHINRDVASEPVIQWYKEHFKLSDKEIKDTPIDQILDDVEKVFKEKFGDQAIKMGIAGKQPTIRVKDRGFVESVSESPNITSKTKEGVSGMYTQKENKKLMGEATALLENGVSIDFKNVKDIDKKITATMQHAINLDKAGDHEGAANLFNNLSKQGTELGRGVQAYSLLNKMSPQAIALSVAGRINQYNKTARRPIPELTGDQQKAISDMISSMDGLTGRDKNIAINNLNEMINGFIPSSIGDKAIAVWKAGLLTSLRTHERNLLGNTIMGGAEIAKDVPAMLFDRIMGAKTGQRTITVTTKGLREGGAKGLQAAKDIITTGFDPEQDIAKYDVQQITWNKNPLEQALKKYTDAVFRTLGAEDKIFWNSSYARSLYDQAGAEAINAGKQGDATFIKKLVDKPTEEMLKNAIKDANYSTFHDKNMVSGLASNIKRVLGKNELTKIGGELLMPFTGVPSSIVGKTIAYSPIGLVKGAINAGKVIINNVPELQRQASQELGRGTIGTGIFGLGAYLMQKGLMTGQPKDSKEADLWKAQGKQANSVMVDGKWRSINSIGPQNLILLAGAKYQEEKDNPEGSMGAYGAGLVKDQLSQTFLQGVQGPLNAINEPQRYGKSYVGGTVSSVIPNIVKDVAKANDPLQREANTIGDFVKSNVPVIRETMLPKRDILGNPIKQEPTGLGAFIDLFNSKKPIENAVIQELGRLNDVGVEGTPSKIQKAQTINKNKVTLTPEQLNAFEMGSAQMLKPKLEALISSEIYKKLDDERKAKSIDKLVTDTRTAYKNLHGDEILGSAKVVNPKYETSKDAPKNVLERVQLGARGGIADPKNTIKAIFTDERMRKMRGDAMVLERKLNLNDTSKKGDARDHIIPLSLGGDNSDQNLRYTANQVNAEKAKLEVKLGNQLEKGEIKRVEAQKQISEFVDRYGAGVPDADTTATTKQTKTGKTYEYVDEKGSPRTIVLTDLTEPTYTGNEALDKKIKAEYSSKITSNGKNILKLYNLGLMTAEEAGKELDSLKEKSTKTKKASKGKKISVKFSKVKAGRIKTSKIKFGKLPSPKKSKRPKLTLKNLQLGNKEYRIKA